MWVNYILLPFGEFYPKTKIFLSAIKGDRMQFFNGPEVSIERVLLIEGKKFCDVLSHMRYGLTWDRALKVWTRYARMEGHGKDIFSTDKCLMVEYNDAD